MTNFGEILMQLRQEKHLSQAELGNVIFVSGGTISNYEKGVHYPDVEKLVALAEYFGVSIDYLLLDVPDQGFRRTYLIRRFTRKRPSVMLCRRFNTSHRPENARSAS